MQDIFQLTVLIFVNFALQVTYV